MPERLLAAALLAVTAAALVWFVRGDLTEWRLFQPLVDTGARQDRFRRWCLKQWLAFVLPSLGGLALLGRVSAIAIMPAGFAPVASRLPRLGPDAIGPLAAGGGLGVAIGAGLAALVMWIRRRRGVERPNPPLTLGDVSALLPRNRSELGWTALLSVSAGVTEELAFRLYLPLLLLLVTRDPFVAFGLAAAAFGAMHLYQGWVGVAATTVVGGLLTAAYLISGSLWVAMLLHTLLDLNALVLRPLLLGLARRPAPPAP